MCRYIFGETSVLIKFRPSGVMPMGPSLASQIFKNIFV